MQFTKNDEETLLFIQDFIETTKLSPTYEEIAAHFGLKCRSAARERVVRLKNHGLVDFSRQSRSIVLLDYDYKLIYHPTSKQTDL